MRLILVRHGMTANNETTTLQTDDITLTDQGERQVRKVSTRLMHETINEMYTSPHLRCKQTTKTI